MENIDFTPDELARYNRHIIIPEFGIEGQKKLKQGKVLVIGSGGLGSPVLLYLAAAGVGTIGIVDYDVVDDSNLQRQVLFTKDDIGKPKVIAAKKKIKSLNPHIKVKTYNQQFTSENALDIIKDFDIVADGTDNFPTRYLVNDACVIAGKINVYASIFRFDGQVSVFNAPREDGVRNVNYRDLFPTPPPPGLVPSCAEGGVLGVLPGIIGALQANEVIKVITGVGEPLINKLYTFNALNFESRTLNIHIPKKRYEITELIDYELFCGVPANDHKAEIREIDVHEFNKIKNEEDLFILDVRENHEYDIVNIGGNLIPLGEIENRLDEIPKDKKVIVHCKLGGRSTKAIETLSQKHNYDKLWNLKGGIIEYVNKVDSSLKSY